MTQITHVITQVTQEVITHMIKKGKQIIHMMRQVTEITQFKSYKAQKS